MDGILLAGGAGTRMGQPKARALIGDRTLARIGVEILAARCTRVLVVTRPECPLPGLDAEVITDRPGPAAALVGLATGLAAATSDDVLVLGCDLPLAGPLLDRLARCQHPGAVIGRDPEGRRQPLCGRYRRLRAAQAADRLIATGRLALMHLLDEVGAAALPSRDEELLNINTPADLARAAAVRAARAARRP